MIRNFETVTTNGPSSLASPSPRYEGAQAFTQVTVTANIIHHNDRAFDVHERKKITDRYVANTILFKISYGEPINSKNGVDTIPLLPAHHLNIFMQTVFEEDFNHDNAFSMQNFETKNMSKCSIVYAGVLATTENNIVNGHGADGDGVMEHRTAIHYQWTHNLKNIWAYNYFKPDKPQRLSETGHACLLFTRLPKSFSLVDPSLMSNEKRLFIEQTMNSLSEANERGIFHDFLGSRGLRNAWKRFTDKFKRAIAEACYLHEDLELFDVVCDPNLYSSWGVVPCYYESFESPGEFLKPQFFYREMLSVVGQLGLTSTTADTPSGVSSILHDYNNSKTVFSTTSRFLNESELTDYFRQLSLVRVIFRPPTQKFCFADHEFEEVSGLSNHRRRPARPARPARGRGDRTPSPPARERRRGFRGAGG